MSTHDEPRIALAWFSPLPPERSGIATYSAELLSRLGGAFQVDAYPESRAAEFVWRRRRHAYDLVVYHMGNSPAHDYMWGYMPVYPGLVVLHDARLHHARARQLLSHGRLNDYRAEFAFNHPDAPPAAAEYAVEGLAGSIYYFWPMLRTVVAAARAIAVHNPYVAAELQTQFPTASITTIRMGVPRLRATPEARAHVRTRLNIPESTVAFAALGKVTAAKRIGATLRAVGQLAREGIDACLLLVGDTEGAPELKREAAAAGVADRLRTVGFVDDAEIAEYLEAADACLCLRWPTAQETSASWLRCLAAHRATVVSNLAHLADVPDGVALRVDLLDEDASLVAAMRRLAVDPRLRTAIADAGHHYWADNHTLEAMADDYQRLLRAAAARPVSTPTALPPHLTRDYSELTRATLEHFGVSIALPG